MTGIEALSLLKDGKILRRTSWESHQKCKALDFFGDWVIIFVKEKNNKISDEDFNSIINGAFIMVEKSFNDLRNELEEINAGEFLHDDWEIVEWGSKKSLDIIFF